MESENMETSPPINMQQIDPQQQQQQFGPPGGPIRGPPQQMQQIRSSPYPPPQQQQQLRPGPPPPQQHFSPQQFAPQNGQPIALHRPQMPPPMHMHQNPMQQHHMPQQQQRFNTQGPPGPPMQQQQQQQFMPPPAPQGLTTMQTNAQSTGSVMEKVRLDDIMSQINKNIVLEEGVKDALVEYADDFVTALINKSCTIMKLRESRKLEGRDVEFILQNVYNIPTVPRASVHIFGAPETIDLGKERHIPTEAHKQRLALLKKQIRKI